MNLQKKNRNNIVSLFILIAILLSFGCSSAVKKGKMADDPFPEEMLGHTMFHIFKSGDPADWLGRVFRDEERQMIEDKKWGGEVMGSGGERREIEYSREQSFTIQTRLPEIKVSLGAVLEGELHFKLIMDGLMVYHFINPVLLDEFRNEPGIEETQFIMSLLQAREIVLQVIDKTGVMIGLEGKLKKVGADFNYKYSKKLKGLIMARDTIIGYYMIEPTPADLKRR